MKTVADLKSKRWYRLLQVLYLGTLLFSVLAGAGTAYTSNEYRSEKDLGITCVYGNKEKYSAFNDKGISIDAYDPNKASLSQR